MKELSFQFFQQRCLDGEWSNYYVNKFYSLLRLTNNSDIFPIYLDVEKDYFYQPNDNYAQLMSNNLNEEKIEEIAVAIMNLSK